MASSFFDWCVNVLQVIGEVTGLGYEFANIVIFVIVQPGLILLFFILWLRARKANRFEDMFAVGARVRHEHFGVGIILTAESVTFSGHPSQDLQIDFGGKVGIKRFLCPPAVLREVAAAVPPQAPSAAAPAPVRRMKVRREWGGPDKHVCDQCLNGQDKQRLKSMFNGGLDDIGTDEDLQYIDGLIGKKLKFLKDHPVRWMHHMGEEATVLYGLLMDHRERPTLTDDVYKRIVMTLYWLVNPMDYFIDTDPLCGHIDDAEVLGLCIKHLDLGAYDGRFIE